MRAARAAGHDPPVLVVWSGRGGSIVGVGGHRTWACTEHTHAMGQDLYRRRFGSVFFFFAAVAVALHVPLMHRCG